MKNRLLVLAACLPLAVACKSEQATPAVTDPNAPHVPSSAQAGSSGQAVIPTAQETAGTAAKANPAFGAGADSMAWSTDKFTVKAGQEQYLCFAKTLEEDLVVNGYATEVQPFVHHLIFARARAPEPEGFAECDVAFRSTWETLFISGAGDTALEFPADAGQRLTKGTQLIVQMHLLNTASKPVEGAVTINMRRSSAASPRPVSTFIFGTAAVELPAASTTEIVGKCPMRQKLQLIAGFPHMHMLGTSLRFEVGTSEGEMREVFKRDPFDFNDQRIDKLDLTLAAGDLTRVTCQFTNTGPEKITYGESTKNEMCYFIGFAIDLPQQSACLEVLPPNIFGK